MQELLIAEKGALEVHCTTSDSALHHSQQQLSELTQKHAAIQAELTESLDYQQQIETQLNELELEAQAAKAGYEAEQAQTQKLTCQLNETQADMARVVNELTHTKTALDQTSELNKELQVSQSSNNNLQVFQLVARYLLGVSLLAAMCFHKALLCMGFAGTAGCVVCISHACYTSVS